MKRGKTRVLWLLLAVTVVGITTLPFLPREPKTTDQEWLARANATLKNHDFEEANAAAAEIPSDSPLFMKALPVRCRALVELGRVDDAARLLNDASVHQGEPEFLSVRNDIAAVQMRDGQLTSAVQTITHILEQNPVDSGALHKAAFLYGVIGAPWKSREYYWRLLQTGAITLRELAIYADVERPLDATDLIDQWKQNQPTDPLVQLATLASEFRAGSKTGSSGDLATLSARYPKQLPLRIMHGEWLLHHSPAEFPAWNALLPAVAEAEPRVWMLRSRWFRQHGQLESAATCCLRALNLAPVYRDAVTQLAQILRLLDHPKADECLKHSRQLFALAEPLDDVLKSDGQNEWSMRALTEQLAQMGRYWEAAGWAVLSKKLFPRSQWPEDVRRSVLTSITPTTPRIADEYNPAMLCDLSEWEADLQINGEVTPKVASTPESREDRQIHFRESPLDFEYSNSPDPETRGARMFEITGGGIGVIDFDADGWPDLFFPQGGVWPPQENAPPKEFAERDELHRNIRGVEFRQAVPCGIGPGGFGQGAAIGDFNEDGLPDILVANIGRNQLYANMGDGTFTEVTLTAGLAFADWTSSCAMADLNGDGLTDLYAANYVTGDDVYTRICNSLACSPLVFEGVPDRLHVNLGNGRFAALTDTSPETPGKGLGVVVAFDQNNLPGLFVANDQVANSYLRAVPDPAGGPLPDVPGLRLQPEALSTGLAYSEDGLAMACMGIACGDANGDETVDFLVTNFRHEPNTLYTQDTSGLYLDSTRPSGLRSASLPYVGWGTQFLDADNDGDQDLVVTNGHVDNYPLEEGGYAMPSQLFRNLGNGQFRAEEPAAVGEFFATRLVGRSLVRLDWNNDGRQDFAVSTLESSARLLTNHSTGGHWIRFRLLGLNGSRDPIGARVQVITDSQTQSQQLTAGDGYMASNQRMLHFGLDDADLVRKVTVTWPNGSTATFSNLVADKAYSIRGRHCFRRPIQ